jgi:hypothetical protein
MANRLSLVAYILSLYTFSSGRCWYFLIDETAGHGGNAPIGTAANSMLHAEMLTSPL